MAAVVAAIIMFFWAAFRCSASTSSTMTSVRRTNGICVELVRPHGYHCEELMIETADGYRLGMQRITSRSSKKGPVVVYHGINNGGDIWLLNPQKQSLPFMLADQGYDVWIPSGRTSTYSYGHVSLNSSDKAYWDWSLDELVEYDLPSVVEQVVEKTGKNIMFVAYSQASQALFAALSEGKMADSIAKIAMLAPVTYVIHTSSPIARVATALNLGLVAISLNIYEFNPKSSSGTKILDVLCAMAGICESDVLSLVAGTNCCLDDTRMDFINRYELQSTSVKNWNHLGQMFQKKNFAKFDYGEKENLRRYGSKVAPAYQLSKFPTDIPMIIVHGGKDSLADAEDVYLLLADLKKPPSSVIYLPHYAHFDFVIGTKAQKDLYTPILSLFEQN